MKPELSIILCLLAVGAASAFTPRGPPPTGAFPDAQYRFSTSYAGRSEDDFASFSDFGKEEEEDDDGGLAKEFYQELEVRGQSPSDYSPGGGNTQNKEERKNTVRTVKNSDDRNSNRPIPTWSSSKESPLSSSLSFFQFFSPPTPRPTTSAGLFSGSGSTVYSSGRSIRAEIEILETTLKNNDARENKKQETEELCRTVALSLVIVLVAAYVVSEASALGGAPMMPGPGAAASSDRVMSLVGGMSGILVHVGHEDVFLGEEAAWLVRESSGLAAFVVEAVRSVEELAPS